MTDKFKRGDQVKLRVPVGTVIDAYAEAGRIRFGDNYPIYVGFKQLELATEEKTMEYQVGDRVQYKGAKGRIANAKMFYHLETEYGATGWVPGEECVQVKEEPLKVGDQVRLVKDNYDYAKGTKATIVGFHSSAVCLCFVRFQNRLSDATVYRVDLEKSDA